MPKKTKENKTKKKNEFTSSLTSKMFNQEFEKMFGDDKKLKNKLKQKILNTTLSSDDSDTESESEKKVMTTVVKKINEFGKKSKHKPLPIEKTEKGNINPCINPFGFVKPKTLNIKELNKLGIKPYVPAQKESQLMSKARTMNVASTFQSTPVIQIKQKTDEELKNDVNKIVKMNRKEREEWRKEAKKKLKKKQKSKSESEEEKSEEPKPPKKIKVKEPTEEEIINNNISKMKQEYTSLDRMMLFNLVEYMYQHLDFKKCELDKKKKDKVYTHLLDVIQKRLLKKYRIQSDMEENVGKEIKKILKLCKSTADKGMIKGYYLDYMTRLPKKIIS